MSINQIQEITKFPGTRKWLNSRVDDLNIYSQLDYDVDSANAGDILVLDASLNPTWLPNSAILSITLDNMMTVPEPFTFVVGESNQILLSNSYVISSPNIIVNANGELVFNQAGIYLVSVNFNVIVSSTTMNPAINLQRWNAVTSSFVDDLKGLAVSAYIPYNGATGNDQTLADIWLIILPLADPVNHRFRIMGSNPGVLNTLLSDTNSSLSVIRIS